MGVSLTWRREDMIQHGKCGPYLDDIVYFEMPGSIGEVYPELESHFVLNDPFILQEEGIDLSLPTYRSGYAVLFKQTMNRLSIGELRSILWDIELDMVPKSHPARYYKIEQAVEQQLSGIQKYPESQYEDFDWNPVRTFVRWVSKDEYLQKAREAQQNAEEGLDGFGVMTRLDFITNSDRHKSCIECPLAIDLEPGKEKSEYYQYCYHGSSSSHYGSFFDFIDKFGDFSILTNQYSTNDNSDVISVLSSGKIPVDELDLLIEELSRSRKILESAEISIVVVYDEKGKEVSKLGQTYYDIESISKGYRVGVSSDKSAITVEYTGPKIFDIPKDALSDVSINKDRYIFYFSEVRRTDGKIIGKFRSGLEMELMPVFLDTKIETPFRGLDDEDKVGRIEHKRVSAMFEYGYPQNIFEKYAKVAKRFNIPIKFG